MSLKTQDPSVTEEKTPGIEKPDITTEEISGSDLEGVAGGVILEPGDTYPPTFDY